MENNKVMVVSTVNAQVGIHSKELRINRVWPKKGTKIQIEKDLLTEAMFEPGVAALFESGILYIEDMEVKKELGLEPETATEPENIIVLTENQMIRLMKVAPMDEFEETVKKLVPEQRKNLVDFAVEKEIADINKADVLKKYTGLDVINFIRLNRSEN